MLSYPRLLSRPAAIVETSLVLALAGWSGTTAERGGCSSSTAFWGRSFDDLGRSFSAVWKAVSLCATGLLSWPRSVFAPLWASLPEPGSADAARLFRRCRAGRAFAIWIGFALSASCRLLVGLGAEGWPWEASECPWCVLAGPARLCCPPGPLAPWACGRCCISVRSRVQL